VTATGPTHAVLAPGFPRWQAAVAVASNLVTIALVALPWLRDPRHVPPLAAWALVAVLSAGGLLVALPLESMSEHYGFGPNVGGCGPRRRSDGVRLAAGQGARRPDCTSARRSRCRRHRHGVPGRPLRVELATGPRTQYGRARRARGHEGDVLLSLPACTAEGPRYNVYILPPADLFSVEQSEYFLDRSAPTRRIRIEVGSTDPDAIPVDASVGARPAAKGRTRPPRLGVTVSA
jgi:hypothetical protein